MEPGPIECRIINSRVPLGAAQSTGMLYDLLTMEEGPIGCHTIDRSHWVPCRRVPLGAGCPLDAAQLTGMFHYLLTIELGPIGCHTSYRSMYNLLIMELGPIGCRTLNGAGAKWEPHNLQVPLGAAPLVGICYSLTTEPGPNGAAQSAGMFAIYTQVQSWVPLGAAQSTGVCAGCPPLRRLPLVTGLLLHHQSRVTISIYGMSRHKLSPTIGLGSQALSHHPGSPTILYQLIKSDTGQSTVDECTVYLAKAVPMLKPSGLLSTGVTIARMYNGGLQRTRSEGT
ncbi:hypothetical protein BDR05DRAFT_950302 [Suillus weaverae]|nr:hypothetical protein BDR05DRAFT_950302 [Suillus weaverae]